MAYLSANCETGTPNVVFHLEYPETTDTHTVTCSHFCIFRPPRECTPDRLTVAGASWNRGSLQLAIGSIGRGMRNGMIIMTSINHVLWLPGRESSGSFPKPGRSVPTCPTYRTSKTMNIPVPSRHAWVLCVIGGLPSGKNMLKKGVRCKGWLEETLMQPFFTMNVTG